MKLDDIIQQPGQLERMHQTSSLKRTHVSVPCKVAKYDSSKRCVDAQPTVRGLGSSENPPLLLNVPVFFPGKFTYDINVGDECLVIFADSCIDGWWETGEVSNPLTDRTHDLSDGIAFVGIRSLPNVTEGLNLDDYLDEIEEKASGGSGLRLYINSDGCLIFEKADGSAYINDDGEVIYEQPPVEDVDFSLNSDGELIMEVS